MGQFLLVLVIFTRITVDFHCNYVNICWYYWWFFSNCLLISLVIFAGFFSDFSHCLWSLCRAIANFILSSLGWYLVIHHGPQGKSVDLLLLQDYIIMLNSWNWVIFHHITCADWIKMLKAQLFDLHNENLTPHLLLQPEIIIIISNQQHKTIINFSQQYLLCLMIEPHTEQLNIWDSPAL